METKQSQPEVFKALNDLEHVATTEEERAQVAKWREQEEAARNEALAAIKNQDHVVLPDGSVENRTTVDEVIDNGQDLPHGPYDNGARA